MAGRIFKRRRRDGVIETVLHAAELHDEAAGQFDRLGMPEKAARHRSLAAKSRARAERLRRRRAWRRPGSAS